VCVGSNVAHGWFTHNCKSNHIKEVTIQFPKDLIDERYLNSSQLINIRNLFENAKRGILFSQSTIDVMTKRILELSQKTGFDSIIELLSIINELSTSRNAKLLSNSTFVAKTQHYSSRRLERVFELMNTDFFRQITLAEAARVAGMSEAPFSRFIKTHTGYNFIDNLNEIRLTHVSRMLVDTSETIADIAFKCGFNNMGHFNRTFKNKKNLTPKEFRGTYAIKGVIFSV
jgi:transcriptional regulator GlxA family with amidase domain